MTSLIAALALQSPALLEAAKLILPRELGVKGYDSIGTVILDERNFTSSEEEALKRLFKNLRPKLVFSPARPARTSLEHMPKKGAHRIFVDFSKKYLASGELDVTVTTSHLDFMGGMRIRYVLTRGDGQWAIKSRSVIAKE